MRNGGAKADSFSSKRPFALGIEPYLNKVDSRLARRLNKVTFPEDCHVCRDRASAVKLLRLLPLAAALFGSALAAPAHAQPPRLEVQAVAATGSMPNV